MTLITNEVYDYILDDVQRSTMRSVSKMNDVTEHLKLQAGETTALAKYAAAASEIQDGLRLVAAKIDQLPALGVDLEKLITEKVPDGPVIRISGAAAIERVGQRMTRGGVEKALIESYDADSVQYDLVKDEYIIFKKEEESR